MPVSLERAGAVAACALCALALVAAGAQSQKTKSAPLPAVDPYTGGEAQRLALLGYRSFGPFLFGAAASDTVQEHLGRVPIQWVETEHFRLGSSLAEYEPELPEEIAELRRELEELHERLADFPAKPKKLDPWLRLHLFARRLENLYADFCARLGVEAPPPNGEPSAPGPVIGMRDKFTVLLTQKRSTLARFTGEYCGEEHDDVTCHHFFASGSLFFGRSAESLPPSDTDLHFALIHGVVQDLIMGINGFPHELPSWWPVGVALWFARDRMPNVLLFSRPPGETTPTEELADWEPLVRGRVEAGAVLGWSEMLARPSWLNQTFAENVVLWSRIDYFLRREGAVAPLVNALHTRARTTPDSAAALALATGLDLDALDRSWKEWVQATYRKKRR